MPDGGNLSPSYIPPVRHERSYKKLWHPKTCKISSINSPRIVSAAVVVIVPQLVSLGFFFCTLITFQLFDHVRSIREPASATLEAAVPFSTLSGRARRRIRLMLWPLGTRASHDLLCYWRPHEDLNIGLLSMMSWPSCCEYKWVCMG